MQIGIIGLGYVGLPLAVAFAEAGHEVVGLDVDPAKVEALNAGRSYVEDVPDAALAPLGERLAGDRRVRRSGLLRRGRSSACRPRSATRASPTSPTWSTRPPRWPRCCARASWSCWSRPPTRAPPASGCCRSSSAPASPPAATSTSPSRRSGSTPAAPTTPCGPRRSWSAALTEACTERARELYSSDLRRGGRPLQPRGGGALEAAGEHLPLGQHRPRQRAGPALRPARDRRLGGDRRRLHQALRVHALRSRAGDGRPLPPGRPLLPRLQGAPARLLPGVHRARRESEPGPARRSAWNGSSGR